MCQALLQTKQIYQHPMCSGVRLCMRVPVCMPVCMPVCVCVCVYSYGVRYARVCFKDKAESSNMTILE